MPSYNCSKVQLLPPHNYIIFKEICPHWEFTISPQAGKSFSCLQCYTGQQESTKQMLSIYSIPCTEGRYEQNLSRCSAHTASFQKCRSSAMRKGQAAICSSYPHYQKEIGVCWDFAQTWEMEKMSVQPLQSKEYCLLSVAFRRLQKPNKPDNVTGVSIWYLEK